ncbi:MAG: MFS transporter [Elusimicrobiaceae bacterium]|nr:MFS transporter [Elusimicrobiaceae bacterium]
MKKLLSCLLSVTLLFSSVAPSLAQVPGRSLTQLGRRAIKPVTPSVKGVPGINGVVDRSVLQHMHLPLTLQHSALLTRNASLPQAYQIVTHANPVHRALLLRSDFTVLALNKQAQPQDIEQALTFYRSQLATADHSFFANASESQAAASVAGTVADIASLGLFGTAAQDAPVIEKVYQASVGTPAEAVVTAVSARALLRLGAYEPLERMSALSTQQPQLWEGIAAYARANQLPLTVAQMPRSAVDVSSFQPALEEFGPLNTLVVHPNTESTFLYMNAGRVPAQAAPAAQEVKPQVRQPAPAAVVAEEPETVVAAQATEAPAAAQHAPRTTSGMAFSSFIPLPSFLTRRLNARVPNPEIVDQTGALGESVSHTLVGLNPEFSLVKEKVNTHYANAKYADAIGAALTATFHSALRKYVSVYGKEPVLSDTKFQEVLVSTLEHELEKAGQTVSALSKASVRQDVLKTFKDSLDPSKEIAPAAAPNSESLMARIRGFFRKDKDQATAARVQLDARAAQFAGLEVDFPVDVEISKGVAVPEDFNITLKFEDESVKKAFIKRVKKLDSEHFVLRTDGALILRSTSGSERGISGVFFEGGQGAASKLYKILAARQMAPRFAGATHDAAAMGLLNEYRESLNAILSKEIKEAHPQLARFLASKSSELNAAAQALREGGNLGAVVQAVRNELNEIVAANVNTPIELSLFTDDLGNHAQVLTAVSEGMSSVGQAITAALKLLGIEKGLLSQLPTTAGQFGPATAPFIGGLQSNVGGKHTLYIGQITSAIGNAISMGSLALGAMGILPTFPTFMGMISGILVNGIAGNGILKQSNVPLAKERANDPISASATAAELNSWASVGGIYCYLFLPAAGALAYLLTGSAEVGLGTLATMFGISTATPLLSAALMRGSKIKNVKETGAKQTKYLQTIKDNLKFGFNSPSLKGMMARVASYHFAGMAFNSGPGTYFKEVFDDPSKAMLASFASVYLTVYAGRKIGAKMMKQGVITDKALIGLSSMIALGAGAASVLPGLDMYSRGALWAAAGLGFANLANMEQAIELNRPSNVGRKAAVSTMYVLARMSGMATILMGAFADQLGLRFGLDTATSAVYALSLPLAALTYATWANREYITKDFKETVQRWFSKTPKTLYYAALRDEVEQAMTKNVTWGTSMSAAESAQLTSQVAAGITSRYTVSLSALEQIRMGVEDKAGLDIHRLEMARKLLQRPVSGTVAGQPLTYDAFREEVEPLYTSTVIGRAKGMSQADIERMTNQVLDGILAKYVVTETEVELIVAKLSHRTALNRNRLAVLDELYEIQLKQDAQAEINSQLKNATADVSKQDIVNHVIEKYRAIAKARGIDLDLSPLAAGAY